MIYLDNAATSFPKPDCVISSMIYAQKYIGNNPGRGGHRGTMKAGGILYSARERLSDMFSCESEGVIFTYNCTYALNMAIKGILSQGDHVIISSLEHNSVLRPVESLREKGIITYDVAFVEPKNEEQTVRSFESLIRKNTKAIICSFASNVFGTVLPVKKIGELCKKRDIIFVVDGAQAAGTLEIDMKEMNIDILCMPGHKGLLGPMGTGVMLLKRGIKAESLIQGGTGSLSMNKSQPETLPDKFESGTVNLPGIAGLLSGINFIEFCGGVKEIHRKESELIEILKEDLSVIKGIRLYGNMNSRNTAPVLSFNLGSYHSEEVGAYLDKDCIAVRAGYHCAYLPHNLYSTADTGVVRVSTGIFNNKKDVKKLAFSLNKIALNEKV